jgi:hypothetical protein
MDCSNTDGFVVNPEISSGLPIPLLNRYPQPGSRAEKYAAPATSASDPAFNPVRTLTLSHFAD